MKTILNSMLVTVFSVGILLLTITPLLASAQSNADQRADRSYELHVRRDVDSRDQVARYRDSEVMVKFSGEQIAKRVRTNGRNVNEVISEYTARDDVEYAEPNYIAHAFVVPNDTYYQPYQWNFDNSTTDGVHAEAAWDITNGSGVVVAVIDTGVAYENHRQGWTRYSRAPDLAGTSFVPGYDFVNNDSHPNDDEGHGTHVTGTIAGTTNNNSGVAGLAHGASIMPIKVLSSSGSGSYADVADGIRFAADNGAQVINLSLGGPSGASYLEEAVKYAFNKGVTIVAASGNDNANTVSYPAAYNDYVIAVGATRFDETIAPYSNTGSSLDLVAPGGDLDVDQNGDGYGDGILQQTFGSNPRSFGYYFYQGTSMATPHVAAAAVMVIANGNATNPTEVQSRLESTADDLGATGRDNTYGYGLINLAAALGGSTPPPPPPPPPEPVPNELPVADAGPDQTATDTDDSGDEAIALDGSNSDDPDGTIVSYLWTENGSFLSTSTQPTQSFTVGQHTVTLEVTDNVGSSSTDTVDITVDQFVPPPPPPPPPSPDPTPTVIFSDEFDNNLDSWTQDNQKDWKDSRRESYHGRYAATVDGFTNDGALISPNFNLASSSTVKIQFAWFIEDKFDTGEYIAFDVSFDGGTSWAEQAILAGNSSPEETWLTESFTIPNVNEIQIRFRGKVSSAIEDGYVDSVVIETL